MDTIQDMNRIKELQQTWNQFEEACMNKKVILFGLGQVSIRFISKYHNKVHIDAAIDNDIKKQGWHIGDFIAEACDTQYEDIVISDISILEKYDSTEVVVLITNKNNCTEIIEQLDKMGIYQYFLYSLIEAKESNQQKVSSSQNEKKLEYISECCNLDISKKKIVVYIGNYGGHGRYITEQLLKMNKGLDIVWIVKHWSIEHPDEVRLIYEGNWKKYILEMETAHIWIYDIIVPDYIRKRVGQIYIQTKHWSSITLKKFFLDDLSTTVTEEDKERVRFNGKIMDYILTGSEFDNKTCKSGFAFQGKFIQIGSARTDAVFNIENRDKVYAKYDIDKEVHSVLYAPTFRYSKEEKKKKINTELDFFRLKVALERRFGGKWVIFLRIHPSIARESEQIGKESYIIDVSNYCDSQELVAASDITISDYSSIMFEPAFAHKPVFLFAPDRNQYVNRERELLIEYESLPFTIAETNEELEHDIANFAPEGYKKRVENFLSKYGVHEDGHASERAARFIIDLLEGKEE